MFCITINHQYKFTMQKQKCLFLDRDGVINIDNGYTHKVKDLVLVDNIIETCLLAISRGYIVVIITNQAGIAKGYYTEEDFFTFMNEIYNVFSQHSILITKTYFCPYHPDAKIEKYKVNSFDRKPNPGMILKAVNDFNIDVSKSILIGDNQTDIQAGENAKIKTNILIKNNTHDIAYYQKIF